MNTPNEGSCTTHTTPLGAVLLCASAQGLAGLWFEGQRHHPTPERVARWTVAPAHPQLRAAARQLDEWFAGHRTAFDLPLDLSAGTAFQRDVWRALQAIPCGHNCSYRTLAQAIDRPQAVRAVGTAIGRNPLSILVPCHRVLGSDGSLTGYAGGLERKRALLRHEARLIAKPHQ